MKTFLALTVTSCLFSVSAFADVTFKEQSDPLANYNASMGRRLANIALGRDGYASAGACYYWAAETLEASGMMSRSDWGRLGIGTESAYMFGDWANANPVTLEKELGLVRVDNRGISTRQAPLGSVFVYEPGGCGYNYTHGHIEVVSDTNYACSDFCHTFRDENACGGYRPFIYVPVNPR